MHAVSLDSADIDAGLHTHKSSNIGQVYAHTFSFGFEYCLEQLTLSCIHTNNHYITDTCMCMHYTHKGWTMTPSPVTVEPCTMPAGPQVPSSRDPLEMFSYFFDDTLLGTIVHETNLFAAQSLAAANSNTTWETSSLGSRPSPLRARFNCAWADHS